MFSARRLEDRDGAGKGDDAARLDCPPDLDHGASPVEEVDVEGEAQTEGVDAGAARNEQPHTGLLTVESNEAKQAGPETDGHWDLEPKDHDQREAAQARSEG